MGKKDFLIVEIDHDNMGNIIIEGIEYGSNSPMKIQVIPDGEAIYTLSPASNTNRTTNLK
ncbi:MAG: hypothetical protein FNT15_07935 [Sulfurovum sp.]|nr:MAG: hypothetical protein FNT15_07935 [Sulfurovum sp.]